METTARAPVLDRIRRRLLVTLCMVACSTSTYAQSSLDALLKVQSQQNNLPALAAAVVVKGRLVAVGTAGTRRAGMDIPVTQDDRFHLGSDTKAMTALLAAMMIEDGRLQWDSTLAQVFPELAADMDARLQQVTITQLLSHTSGLPPDDQAFGELMMKALMQDGNLDERRYWMLQQMAPLPLAAPPGSRFAYSNLGYVVAGAVIERVSGKTWEELMVERIFDPLGLKTAGLGPQASMGRVDAPLGHRLINGKLKAILSGPEADNPSLLGPAGTAHMSVLDFARWGSWMAAQGQRGPSLVKPATLKKLVTPQIAMPLASTTATTATTVAGVAQYALGWGNLKVAWSPKPLVFHGGSNTLNKAHIWLDTERDAVVVVLTNIATTNTEDVMMQLAGQLYTTYVGNNVQRP